MARLKLLFGRPLRKLCQIFVISLVCSDGVARGLRVSLQERVISARPALPKRLILSIPRDLYDSKYFVHLSPIDGRQLASFFERALDLGHQLEVFSLIDKFRQDISGFDKEDFLPTVIPFLRGFIWTLTKAGMDSLTNPCYQGFFRYALRTYLMRCVEMQPMPPNDWSRPRILECSKYLDGRPYTCNICVCITGNLLQDSERRDMEMQIPKDRHQHIWSSLRCSKIDCRVESIKRGKFWHIRFTKTKDQYDTKFHGWDQRRKIAKGQLHAFDQGALKTLLGDRYQATMALSDIRLYSELAQQPRALQPVTTNAMAASTATSSNEGSKRKAIKSEVIDLTEDVEGKPTWKRKRFTE
jgi:hypothetical protein